MPPTLDEVVRAIHTIGASDSDTLAQASVLIVLGNGASRDEAALLSIVEEARDSSIAFGCICLVGKGLLDFRPGADGKPEYTTSPNPPPPTPRAPP